MFSCLSNVVDWVQFLIDVQILNRIVSQQKIIGLLGQGVLEPDYLRSLLMRAQQSALSLEAVDEGVTVRAVVTSWRHDSIRPKKS